MSYVKQLISPSLFLHYLGKKQQNIAFLFKAVGSIRLFLNQNNSQNIFFIFLSLWLTVNPIVYFCNYLQ